MENSNERITDDESLRQENLPKDFIAEKFFVKFFLGVNPVGLSCLLKSLNRFNQLEMKREEHQNFFLDETGFLIKYILS